MNMHSHLTDRINQLAQDVSLSTSNSYTRMCETMTRFYSEMARSNPANQRRTTSRDGADQKDAMLNEGGRED